MRIVLQRVSHASVCVDGKIVGKIGNGLFLLVGIGPQDSSKDLEFLAKKCVEMRIFEDENGKMNLSLTDIGGAILAVSQFTLYADCRKGRRPGFSGAASPQKGENLFNEFIEIIKNKNIPVETGVFGAHMGVELCNSGPATIFLDSEQML